MQKPKDWDEVKVTRNFPKLPADGYVCKIITAKERTYSSRNGDSFTKLEIAFDIIEGEYTNYFQDEFDLQQQEDKRWKGVLRLYYGLKGDGGKQDGWTKSALKGFWAALEASNTGFDVSADDDWKFTNLDTFKGKLLGIVFRDEEWDYNGKTGWKAQPCFTIAASAIREGNFEIPKEKPLANKPAASSSSFTVMDESEDLPF